MEMNELRKKIDEVDALLLPLLEERMTISQFIGEYKKSRGIPILNQKREEEIIDKVKANSKEELKDYTAEIYRQIMRVSREYQDKILKKED